MNNTKTGLLMLTAAALLVSVAGCSRDSGRGFSEDCLAALNEAWIQGEISAQLQERLVALHAADVDDTRVSSQTRTCLEDLARSISLQRHAIVAALTLWPHDEDNALLAEVLVGWCEQADAYLTVAMDGEYAPIAALAVLAN